MMRMSQPRSIAALMAMNGLLGHLDHVGVDGGNNDYVICRFEGYFVWSYYRCICNYFIWKK